MHYFQFNIGDYQSHTNHLSPMEDLAYRRLLDWYYLHEKPIPLDVKSAARLIRLNDCSTDVQQVLNEFFTETENGWINKRSDREIELFKLKNEMASKAGKASAEARKANKQASLERPFNDCSTAVQPNINQEPLTINHNKRIVDSEKSSESTQIKKCTFATWKKKIKLSGEKLLSDYRPVWAYAQSVGIPDEWVHIAWERFEDRYEDDANTNRKLYIDWRRTFLRSIKENWFRLWYMKDGALILTTSGLQADLETKDAA